MNILFLTIIKVNDISERGIYTDLMRHFKAEGHNVYITCPTERRYSEKTNLKDCDNIKVLSVKTLNIQKTNMIEKGIATLTLEKQFLKAIIAHYSSVKFDLILYSTPPITFSRIVQYIKKRDNAISYLLLKDIFPQNAVDLHLLKKNGLIHQYFEKKEQKLYKVSDFIGCMSPANVEFIVNNNPELDASKVEVSPNSIIPVEVSITAEQKRVVRLKYGIAENAVVFIYGGNLGKPQGIDFLLDILESNLKNSDAFFLIVGTGTEYSKIENWFKVNRPGNALLLESLPKHSYDILLPSCDVGMILLDKRFTIPNFPSRLLSYLECKLPVIAATDNVTDMGSIMSENKFGEWSLSGDLESFNESLNFLVANRSEREQMGLNGYSFMMENYLTKNTYQTIMKHFL